MAKWQDAVITNKGLELLGSVITGGTLTITSASLGGATVDTVALINQTALKNPITAPVAISQKVLVAGEGVDIKVQIRNSGVTSTQVMKQVGLFAKVSNGAEILFAIMQDTTGEEIPSSTDYPDFMLEFTCAVAISNTGNVEVQVSGSAVITRADLEEELKKYAKKSDIPTKLPANGGNADTVDGKHATDFAQNISSWTTGAVKTLLLAAKSGFVFIQPSVTGMPVDGKYWFGIIHGTGSHRQLIATNISTSEMYTIVYNSALAEDKRWSSWKNVADGGDALTLNGVSAYEYQRRIRHGINIGTNPDATDNQGLYFFGKEGTTLATGSISNAIATNGDSVTTIDARNNKASEQARYRIDIRSNADGSGYVAVTAPSSSGRSALRNISSGSPAATTALCPAGAWYGQYE